MDHVWKGKGQSKMTYSELEEEYRLLKMSKQTDEKQFEDMYTEIHDENKKLKVQILILQMEKTVFCWLLMVDEVIINNCSSLFQESFRN